MKTERIALAMALTAMSVGSAHAIDVHKTGMAEGALAEVWEKIGAFCAINDWHPAVTECVESQENGDTFRTLTLSDGGTIKEKLVEQTDTGYTYEIVGSPLPVQNYRSTFSVMDHGDETMIEWRGTFDAKEATADDAEGVIFRDLPGRAGSDRGKPLSGTGM